MSGLTARTKLALAQITEEIKYGKITPATMMAFEFLKDKVVYLQQAFDDIKEKGYTFRRSEEEQNDVERLHKTYERRIVDYKKRILVLQEDKRALLEILALMASIYGGHIVPWHRTWEKEDEK